MDKDDQLKLFLFDARFVKDKGVACFVKVMSGRSLDFEKIKQVLSYHNMKRYEIYDVGVIQPQKLTSTKILKSG